jgi:hypothetical protein
MNFVIRLVAIEVCRRTWVDFKEASEVRKVVVRNRELNG